MKSTIRAEPGGGWDGTAKAKLVFSAGGAIQFGKHLRHMQQGQWTVVFRDIWVLAYIYYLYVV